MLFFIKNNATLCLTLCAITLLIWAATETERAPIVSAEVGEELSQPSDLRSSNSPNNTNQLSSRIGFGLTKGPVDITSPAIASLQAGFYGHWLVEKEPHRPNDMAYVQMVGMRQRVACVGGATDTGDRNQCPYVTPHAFDYTVSQSAIVEVAQANPGSTWLLGNEPDRFSQDEMLPESYAQAYHELYQWIKAADPTAQVANAGVVQPTPLRLQYLERVWNAYQTLYGQEMPVDIWNVHNFILSEHRYDYGAGIPPGLSEDEGRVLASDMDHVNMDIFKQQIRDFRAWMKDHGQQEKPLIISEYGVLYWHCTEHVDAEQTICAEGKNLYDAELVRNFMLDTFDFFLNTQDCAIGYAADDCRLVQRWMWYALNDDGTQTFNPYMHLYNYDSNTLSESGMAFQNYVAANQAALQLNFRSVLGTEELPNRIYLPYIQR